MSKSQFYKLNKAFENVRNFKKNPNLRTSNSLFGTLGKFLPWVKLSTRQKKTTKN